MSGSDAELRSRAEELAYLEQRFDIHVMAFADQSEATAQALQRAFAVDRATAQRMLEGTPVVVKRGATPEVASALLDELGRVGAQVVLLPSDTKGSLPPEAARAASPSPKAHATTPHTVSSGPVKVSAWGGLDLPSTPPTSSAVASSLPGQLAGGYGGADDLEESLEGADDATGLPSDPAPVSEPELRLHASAPPALQRSRSARRASQEIDLDAGGDSLEASRMIVNSPLRASTPPHPPRSPKPAVPESPAPPPPRPPPPEARRSLRPSDLGLNTVPPLPPRKSQVDFVPLPPSNTPTPGLSVSPRAARGRPPPPAAPAPAPRLPAPVEPHLPSVPRAPETRRIARAAAPAGSKQQRPGAEPTRGGAKRGPKTEPKQEQQRQPTGPVRTVFERDPFPAGLSGPRGEFPVGPQPGTASPAAEPARAPEARRADKPSPGPATSKPAEPPARGLAVVMLLGSVLGVGLGIYVGDSVLQGLASPLSIALHGVALYGFGAGILGLRS